MARTTGRAIGAVLCAAALLLASACGSGDDDKAAEALAKSLRENDGAGDLALTKKESECVADKMVEKVGTEDLQKYGILTEDLETEDDVKDVKMSKGDAGGAADAMTECVDAVDLLVSSLGENADQQAGDCLRKALDEDDIHDFFAALFRGDQESASKKLTQPMMGCATAGDGGNGQDGQDGSGGSGGSGGDEGGGGQ